MLQWQKCFHKHILFALVSFNVGYLFPKFKFVFFSQTADVNEMLKIRQFYRHIKAPITFTAGIHCRSSNKLIDIYEFRFHFQVGILTKI